MLENLGLELMMPHFSMYQYLDVKLTKEVYSGSNEWNALTPDMRNTKLYLHSKFLQKKEMLRPLEAIVLLKIAWMLK